MTPRALLSALARRLRGRGPADAAARQAYLRDLAAITPAAEARGMEVLRYRLHDAGAHPEGYSDFECRFAAAHLRRARPARVLDVGSYRQFVLGLAGGTELTSLDVRPRGEDLSPERVLVGDARLIPAPDGAFDAVVSLSSVEHFGLGRYGDPLGEDSDLAAAAEMRRVLAPGGILIITTTLTRGRPVLAFNAHRIYDLAGARGLFGELQPVEERFFSLAQGAEVPLEQVSAERGAWDVYCGCWRKAGA